MASRLHQAHAHLCIALIEAGPDEHNNPEVQTPHLAPKLHGTPLQYNYKTVPQTHLNDRLVGTYGGRMLSGGSAVNYGAFTRGHSVDYDDWARVVKDSRWNYESLIPFFKRSEHYHESANPDQHGFEGPIHTSTGPRGYPLRESMKKALCLGTGLEGIADMNAGDPRGVAPLVENWREVTRQPAGLAYSLDGVDVMVNRVVRRLVCSKDTDGKLRATGAELEDSTVITARKEVVVSCGCFRTPQLLMLSGIGPKHEIGKLSGIEHLLELPVGQYLHDHSGISLVWKLRHPEKGLSFGSPEFRGPNFFKGNPIDWVTTMAAPGSDLQQAAQKDGEEFRDGERSDIEIIVVYAPTSSAPKPLAPRDGTHITTVVLCLSPTSRGSISLHSSDPRADPLIDPNYFATEHDRAVLRAGLRAAMRSMESEAGREVVIAETTPDGLQQLNSKSTDEELDERVKAFGWNWYHPGGSCSMGKVVDSECRVYGASNLRVIDASIFPRPLSAHYQAPMVRPFFFFFSFSFRSVRARAC